MCTEVSFRESSPSSSGVLVLFAPPRRLLLLFWVIIVSTAGWTAHGQVLDSGAIGNMYVGKFEDACATPLREYSDCLDRSAGSSSCFNENLELLTCTGNCPSEFQASWFCLSRPGSPCTLEIAAWVGCATDYCADAYLSDYAKCVQENASGQCSNCHSTIFLASDDTPISKPVCSDLQDSYCEWQSCCEPCQYLLNLYGRCMQVNFNVCNQQGITSLANCPFVIPDAITPTPPLVTPVEPMAPAPTSSPQPPAVPDGGGEGGDAGDAILSSSSSPPPPRPLSTSTAAVAAAFYGFLF